MTDEHVFPEAIGGHLILRTAVCKGRNDQLGAAVDCALADDFLVQILRLGLRIPNKTGAIPAPLHDGLVKGHPRRRGTYSVSSEGIGRVRLRPLVERAVDIDGRPVVKIVADSEDEGREILQKLTQRAARRGQRTAVIDTWREVIRSPTVVKQVRTVPGTIIRPLLKIAYELGVLWLGSDYSRHVCGLPLARAVVTGFVSEIEAELRHFPLRSVFKGWDLPSTHHAATLQLVDGRIWVAFRVFNVIEARVLVADTHRDFPSASAQWIVLNPLAGNVARGFGERPDSLEADSLNRIAWEQLGTQRYRVIVHYRGRQTTSTELELESR